MITTWDGLLARLASGYGQMWPFYGDVSFNSSSPVVSQPPNALNGRQAGFFPTTPGLPSGVTGYLVVAGWGVTGVGWQAVAMRLINLGTLDIAGASGTFTDGVAFPTLTELGVSRPTSGPLFVEVTTALSSQPGSLSVTFVDDAGNTGQVTTGSLTASALKGSGVFMFLGADDFGLRDITAASRTGGTAPTGVLTFWGVAGVMVLPMPTSIAGVTSFVNGPQFDLVKAGAGETWRIIIFTTSTVGLMGGVYVIGDD